MRPARLGRTLLAALALTAGAGIASRAPLAAQEPDPQPAARPAAQPAALPDAAAARAASDRALQFLVTTQRPDGAWGSGATEHSFEAVFSIETPYAWQFAAQGLACIALLEAPATEPRDQALDRALHWLATTRLPQRGNDWDNDAVWAWLYGTVACVRAIDDERLREPLREQITARGRACIDRLVANQTPDGGWGYYDDPPYTRRPKWATSFSTACVVPALHRALDLGWLADRAVLARAVGYVRACQLPDNAYSYDLTPIARISGGEHINRIKGSLGRTQIGNWALHTVGDESVPIAKVRDGIEKFFAHHEFLRVARMRPIPHEAYYLNAGYFFLFGHCYAAQAIELLPEGERAAWHARLRAKLLAVQRPDGSFCDFLGSSYLVTAGTSFAILALEAGL